MLDGSKLFSLNTKTPLREERYLSLLMINIPTTKYSEKKVKNKRTAMSQKNVCKGVAKSMK
jgi:hypothetical protein